MISINSHMAKLTKVPMFARFLATDYVSAAAVKTRPKM